MFHNNKQSYYCYNIIIITTTAFFLFLSTIFTIKLTITLLHFILKSLDFLIADRRYIFKIPENVKHFVYIITDRISLLSSNRYILRKKTEIFFDIDEDLPPPLSLKHPRSEQSLLSLRFLFSLVYIYTC